MVSVSRPINRISLNGDEFLLDDNGAVSLFRDECEAREFLRSKGLDPEAYNYRTEEKPTKPLYKTTIIIWSEYDTSHDSIRALGDNVADRDACCSKFSCEAVQEPDKDPDFGDTDFFDEPFDDEEVEV